LGLSFTEHDVRECRRLMIGCRTGQLAIGDILAASWAYDAAATTPARWRDC
jgi:hypothetical protein